MTCTSLSSALSQHTPFAEGCREGAVGEDYTGTIIAAISPMFGVSPAVEFHSASIPYLLFRGEETSSKTRRDSFSVELRHPTGCGRSCQLTKRVISLVK